MRYDFIRGTLSCHTLTQEYVLPTGSSALGHVKVNISAHFPVFPS